jgi:peptide/nickel transport system substrate-binding protein
VKSKTTFSGLAAVAAASLVLTACSSDSSNSSNSSVTNDTTSTSNGGGSDASHRGGTFTMLWSSAGISIDPATDYDRNWFILRSTHDGLMAWKQVGGTDGNTLVPDLATEIPKSTDNDTTWAFTLRDGISFSDGTPLKASDIAYSLTRQFKIPGPGVGLYSAIKGADTCIATPADCDLSQGVVTDDKAGTVTFHLAQPDPDFLQKLALPFAYAVPSGTPNEEAGTKPIPGTGPYVITNYSPGKSMSLGRNPEFTQWSADAQPDGYPDRIEMKIGLTDSDATTEVEKGNADWVYETPPPDRLGEVADNYPDQIHITPTVIQYGMTLNTRVPPFDNQDVRQAVNFATDRNAAIGLFGGQRLATPSCQILPPNFPGYQPYCPYTVNPGDKWTAPDMDKAQELVDGSGTKGAKVAVITTPDEASKAMSLYFVSLLNDLGYDASLKTLNASVAYSYVQDSRNKAQMYYSYWAPDYTAASNFLNIQVGCGGFHEASTASPNLSEFCDPQIDALTKQAMSLQGTDPDAADAKWAEIDRLVTDAAPLVQLFTANKLDFVSKRVGNYQYSPSVTGNFLFTQAWVQ